APDVPVYIDGGEDLTVADLLPRPFVLGGRPTAASAAAPPKPRLALDLDNVLADSDPVVRQVIRDHTRGRVNLDYSHVLQFHYHECRDARGESISRAEWDAVHAAFSAPERLMAVSPYPGVQAHLERLGAVFDLHIVTARLPQARETTVRWLAEHAFPQHRLHFLNHGEKHQSLGRFFAAVEDDRAQAEAFALAGVHSFVLAHPWNAVPPDALLHRHGNWDELTAALLRLAGAPPSI
ncbi:unnamed protein product, partial [Phaeothamnion confervicola]